MHPLLPWLVATSLMLHGADGGSTPADSVRSAPDVRDPVFAYLAGLIDSDLYGSIDAATLGRVVARTNRTTRLPYEYLHLLTREVETRSHTAMVVAEFNKPLSLQIPYQMLGYHPGRLRSTQTVRMREWLLGDTVFAFDADGKKGMIRLTDIHLLAVLDGKLMVDIDGWLDRMAGGKIDDTLVTGLVLFRSGGERYGMAVGYNRKWQGRSGLLSFREDEIRFPSPAEMKVAAWRLRQILEGLEPSCRPDSLRKRGVY